MHELIDLFKQYWSAQNENTAFLLLNSLKKISKNIQTGFYVSLKLIRHHLSLYSGLYLEKNKFEGEAYSWGISSRKKKKIITDLFFSIVFTLKDVKQKQQFANIQTVSDSWILRCQICFATERRSV